MFTTGYTALIEVSYITLILNRHDLMMPEGQTLWRLHVRGPWLDFLSASLALRKSLFSSVQTCQAKDA